MSYSIMIIEDDPISLEMMQEYLELENFHVETAANAQDGLNILNVKKFDVLILDINLPDYNGFEVCNEIRKFSNIPIIYASAYNDDEHKLQGFKLGADDYMTKPINLNELVARIWVNIRRASSLKSLKIAPSSIIIDEANQMIHKDNKPLELTAIEYSILSYMIQNKNKTISRDEFNKLINIEKQSRSSIDFHIKNIRKKIGDNAKSPRYIKMVYAKGYRYNE